MQKSSTTKGQNAVAKPTQGKRKFVPFLVDSFDIKNFKVDELQTNNERSKSQMIAYLRYGDGNVVFQTPEFELSQYGIPPLGEYAKTDEQRTTLKLPLDQQEGCMSLEQMFMQIDKQLTKEEKKIFKEIQTQKPKWKFIYKPIVRTPQEQDEILDPKAKQTDKPKIEKCNFWKAKLDINYDTKEIQTVVFVRNKNDPTEKSKRVHVKTVTDLTEYVSWGSKVRMIVMANKLWADKTAKNQADPNQRIYGISFKILSIETTPSEKTGSYKDALKNYAFIDVGDEEKHDEDDKEADKVKEDNDEKEEDDDDEEEEDEEEEEEESDEDPEPPKSSKKPPAKPSSSKGKSR